MTDLVTDTGEKNLFHHLLAPLKAQNHSGLP